MITSSALTNLIWWDNLCPSLDEDFSMYVIKDINLNWSISIASSISVVPYFNLFNNIDTSEATKVAKIRMDAAKYLDYFNDSLIDNWELSSNEISKLIDILKSHKTLYGNESKDSVFKQLLFEYKNQQYGFWQNHEDYNLDMPDYNNLVLSKNQPINQNLLNRYWLLEDKLGESRYNCVQCNSGDSDQPAMSLFIVKNISEYPYFIVYNNIDPSDATKVARIRLDKPEYLKYNNSYQSRWYLGFKDLKNLMYILHWVGIYNNDENSITTYQHMLEKYNKLQCNKSILDTSQYIPDYTLLLRPEQRAKFRVELEKIIYYARLGSKLEDVPYM